MTRPSDGTAGAQHDAVRRAVADMLAGSGLEIREMENGLVIVNPKLLDRGQVHIDYDDGYVSWERVTWDYWGVLEGFERDDDKTTAVGKIIDTLTTS